jgi:hypothetical protein
MKQNNLTPAPFVTTLLLIMILIIIIIIIALIRSLRTGESVTHITK